MTGKKRVRERDPSPDMFLMDDEGTTDEEEDQVDTSRDDDDKAQLRDSGICDTETENMSKAQHVVNKPEYLFETPKSQLLPPKKRQVLTSTMNNQQQENIHSLDPKQSVVDCSMNSLMSSANSTYNCGLNRKMNEALRSSTQTKRKLNYSITNCSPPDQTPPVYTLNNNIKVATQLPVHSGPKYGLSETTWQVIKKTKGIRKLYDWQEECLNKALQTEKNLIYSLPTSGGKTLVAELLMMRELLCKQKDCLYVLPYVSIVQEKVRTLSSQAVALDFAVDEYASDRGVFPPRKRKSRRVIYIATMEKAQGIVNSLMELGRLSEIGNTTPFFLLFNQIIVHCPIRIGGRGRNPHDGRREKRSGAGNLDLQTYAVARQTQDCGHECDNRKHLRIESLFKGKLSFLY